MCHIHPGLDWEKYILNEAVNRDQHELALATCEECLQEYMDLLHAVQDAPSPEFSDTVMAALPVTSRSNYITFKPVLHYLVAASLTLALIELGAFDWVFSQDLAADSNLFAELLETLQHLLSAVKTNLGGI